MLPVIIHLIHLIFKHIGLRSLNMRFSLCSIVFVFLGATQAATSPTNQLCGSKEECETNCENGTYHTESSRDSTYLACTLDRPVKYDLSSCVQPQGTHGEPGHRPTRQGLRALCESVNGQLCTPQSCIFIQSESNVKTYRHGCSIDNDGGSTLTKDVDYEKFQSKCKRL